jgi:septal ring factor EnvC (AmiA/AmiB activator)
LVQLKEISDSACVVLFSFVAIPERLVKEIRQLQQTASADLKERYEGELQNLMESEQSLLTSNAGLETSLNEITSTLVQREDGLRVLQARFDELESKHFQLQQQLELERKSAEALRIEIAKSALQADMVLQLRAELTEARRQYIQACKNESQALGRESVILERLAGLESPCRNEQRALS